MIRITLFLFNLFIAKACLEYELNVRSDDQKSVIRLFLKDNGDTKILKSEEILKLTKTYQCWEGKDNYKFCVNHEEKYWEMWTGLFYSSKNQLKMTSDGCSFEDEMCSTTYSDKLYCDSGKPVSGYLTS
ncbi:hypothetical protein BB558_005261 [Smittium angustum]|uniref:Uncharacterized protein n=1 Tax=Smittium angustum TaxID=133377 RepID=A0A2U1J0Y4_SMIAN|nr:hypothetical protein BB558_005855 [Smittium angustum]PVZ98726.1 hypothetical protein BB558_005261 [Smittium angustum]